MSDLGNKKIISNNLKRYIELSGKNRTEIANQLNVSYSTLSDWINGKTYPRIDKIETMARYFGIMKSDLVEKQSDLANDKSKKIPLLGTIAAGLPLLAQENIEGYFDADERVLADFALRVYGDSMIDEGIFNNDIVFIKQQCDLENGEIGAFLTNGDATLKKFHKENGTIMLLSANKDFLPQIHVDGDLKILGKLIAVLSIR